MIQRGPVPALLEMKMDGTVVLGSKTGLQKVSAEVFRTQAFSYISYYNKVNRRITFTHWCRWKPSKVIALSRGRSHSYVTVCTGKFHNISIAVFTLLGKKISIGQCQHFTFYCYKDKIFQHLVYALQKVHRMLLIRKKTKESLKEKSFTKCIQSYTDQQIQQYSPRHWGVGLHSPFVPHTEVPVGILFVVPYPSKHAYSIVSSGMNVVLFAW